MKKNILTGIKPTGTPHIGNYFGAIKPALEMMSKGDANYFLFVADYHAYTTVKDPNLFQQYVHEIAATWLAFGLDPKKVT
jgi:tryptophanyl-tRNA synthetase